MSTVFMKLKLGQQLMVGFSLLVMITMIVSVTGYLGLNSGYHSFVEYRGLARDTNLAGRLTANMLVVRISALKYIDNSTPDALEQYTKRMDELSMLIEVAKKEIQNPHRREMLDEAIVLIEDYNSAFLSVKDWVDKRHQVVKNELNPTGLKTRKLITGLIETGHADKNEELVYLSGQAQQTFLLGRLYVTKYLVTNDTSDYERAVKELSANLPQWLEKIAAFSFSVDVNNRVAQTQQSYLNYLSLFEETYRIITERNSLIDNVLNKNGPIVAGLLEKIKLSVKSDQDNLGPRVQEQAQVSTTAIVMVSLVALVFGVFISWYISRVIRKPIGGEPADIGVITESIAKGDLSANLGDEKEAHGIFRSVINMTKSLKSLVSAITSSGSFISKSAVKVSKIAQQTNREVGSQRELTEQLAMAVNELVHSFDEVVKNAEDSSRESHKAKEQADLGKDIVGETQSAIKELANKVNRSVDVIKSLEKSSIDIGSVVEVINGISEQTNLLALNAAIEAARAGEQGRGFAVVADEVRGLAQRTRDSTSEIQDIIKRLQDDTSSAVVVMEESLTDANNTVDSSVKTIESFDKILSVIIEIGDRNVQVEAAVREQSNVAEEVNQKISAIREISENTAKVAEQTAVESGRMTSMADTLLQEVTAFKIK